MKKLFALSLLSLSTAALAEGETLYQVSFENAVHQEARISATFTQVENQVLEVQMSRSSPGRYAMHEFIKNVYNVSAVNSVGQPLEVERVNPYQWHIEGHDGEVTLTYTLFGDRADGTYSQIDRTHAHLNMPATFAWATGHEDRAIEVEFTPFQPRWKVATQLVPTSDKYKFTAPDLDYFLDSPTTLSDHSTRSWKIGSGANEQTIKLAIHHDGTEEDVDKFTDMIKAVVDEQIELFGEAPKFDYGEYTFIAAYLPHVDRDGMEHRNSTILTNKNSLFEGDFSQIGTVSHEFIHVWNVERIRPKELEPFNFLGPNLTPSLWLAEGFTTYYTYLTIKRAQLWDQDKFLDHLGDVLNQAMFTPGREYRTPQGASHMATFVDAGVSKDEVNYVNNYFSYYTYGRAKGLALDLMIRSQFPGKSLDDFMRQMWKDFGVEEIPYSNDDARNTLAKVTDKAFADKFFAEHIEGINDPDYVSLFANAGLIVQQKDTKSAYAGEVQIKFVGHDAILDERTLVGSPIYQAGLDKGDEIVKLGRFDIDSKADWNKALKYFKPGESTTIEFIQRGETLSKKITFTSDPKVEVVLMDDAQITEGQRAFLTSWIGEDKADDSDPE